MPIANMTHTIANTTAGRWFKRVLWIGILANLALAIPTLFAPEAMLELTGFPQTVPIMWTRFAALLLILLSIFYMPAGIDPDRYRAIAWLAILGRLAGVIFFLGTQAPEYRMLGVFDLVFCVPEFIFLTLAIRQETTI
jgi:hypothetical protein